MCAPSPPLCSSSSSSSSLLLLFLFLHVVHGWVAGFAPSCCPSCPCSPGPPPVLSRPTPLGGKCACKLSSVSRVRPLGWGWRRGPRQCPQRGRRPTPDGEPAISRSILRHFGPVRVQGWVAGLAPSGCPGPAPTPGRGCRAMVWLLLRACLRCHAMLRYGGQQSRCLRCSDRETTGAVWVGDLPSFRWTYALAASHSSGGPPSGVGVACFFNISQFSHHPQIIISPSPLPVPPFPSGRRRRPPPLPPPPARPLPPPGEIRESAMLPNSGGNSDDWRSVVSTGPKRTLIMRRAALEEL